MTNETTTENVTLRDSPENVTLGDTNTPRIEQTYSGGPENGTVPGYGKAPVLGGDMEKDMTLAATYSSNGLPH